MDFPLQVDNLTKVYGRQRGIDGASFTVRPGRIVGLLGPNGSGKSTTLHCITGYHRLSSGGITIAGHPHDTAAAKNRLGFLPDDLPLPESLSGRELLMLHAHLRPGLDLAAAHDLFAAERGCDEVVIVSEGRVVTQGAPAELLERHRAANLEALSLPSVEDIVKAVKAVTYK